MEAKRGYTALSSYPDSQPNDVILTFQIHVGVIVIYKIWIHLRWTKLMGNSCHVFFSS